MYFVYVILQNNGNLYIGYSKDLKKRIRDHKGGKVRTTRNNRPLKLILYECYLLEDDAKRREKYLKSSDGKRDLKRQLSSAFAKYNIHKNK